MRAASVTGCVRQKTARSLTSSCDDPLPHHVLQSQHHHSSTTYLSSTVWRSDSSGPWQARHNAAAAVDVRGMHEVSVRMPKDDATHAPTVRQRISACFRASCGGYPDAGDEKSALPGDGVPG